MKSGIVLLSLILLSIGLSSLGFKGDGGISTKISDFTVYGKKDHVKITWITTERKNVRAYNIERSRDGKKFTVLRTVESSGEKPSALEYFELDNEPLPGWSYYRLAIVDQREKHEYSGIAPVFFGLDRIKKGQYIAARNPTKDEIPVDLNRFHDEQVLLVLRDAGGMEYYVNQKLNVKGGRLNIMAGKEVPQGIYVITASSKDELIGLEIFSDKQ
ncbi:MAG: hypothetical protein WEC59_10490 [Salibacteraceae bacterium]